MFELWMFLILVSFGIVSALAHWENRKTDNVDTNFEDEN